MDDHVFVRAGLRATLKNADDIQLVGECADGDQVLAAVGTVCPDVVLMDRQMPVMTGVAATRALLDAHPSVKVVMISAACSSDAVREAAQAGAAGYLVKDGNSTLLIAAIRAVANGVPVWPD